MTLIILGPQGSGKGTQAALLADHFGLAKFSMGDALREVASTNTPLGKRIKPVLERGDLISLTDTRAVLREKFSKLDPAQGVVIEGIPRSHNQIGPLLKVLGSHQLDEPWLIELDISDQTAIARIAQRRICSVCQHPAMPQDTSCIRCGSKLIGRADEDDETLKNRLKIYHEKTRPVIEYFKKKHRHILIDGEPPIDRVYEQIIRALKG